MGLGSGLSISSGSYASEFTLTDISDLSLWLKNNTSITVSRWDSSASVTNHASQSSEANQAALSGGGLDFDGGNDVYELTSNIAIAENGGFCLAVVIELEAVDNATIAADDSAAKAQISVVDGTSFKFRATDETTTTFVFPSGTFSTQKMLVMLNRTSGASNRFTFSKNGSPLTPDTDNSVNEAQGENPKPFDFVYMGAVNQVENFFNGKILELAFWSKGLSSAEQGAASSYLQGIHGL
tara:strand:+ start:125 stop:841 length:717 start_codon:yes stop_codon:yes gene_type:complete